MIREIVRIDEERCDGCGLCVPACHEGAIRIENGKARLVSDRLCDGLGACLGHCPQDAITIERREADEFDEELVARQTAPGHGPQTSGTAAPVPPAGGCPGSRMQRFAQPAAARSRSAGAIQETPSELTHWPVQLNLLPPRAPVLKGARLLVAADCVPVACGAFHQKLLRDRVVLIGCPKFDDLPGYVERLTAIMQCNELREIIVARMEVPCCAGIVSAVAEARRRADARTPVTEIVVSTRGEVKFERPLPTASAAY